MEVPTASSCLRLVHVSAQGQWRFHRWSLALVAGRWSPGVRKLVAFLWKRKTGARPPLLQLQLTCTTDLHYGLAPLPRTVHHYRASERAFRAELQGGRTLCPSSIQSSTNFPLNGFGGGCWGFSPKDRAVVGWLNEAPCRSPWCSFLPMTSFPFKEVC